MPILYAVAAGFVVAKLTNNEGYLPSYFQVITTVAVAAYVYSKVKS